MSDKPSAAAMQLAVNLLHDYFANQGVEPMADAMAKALDAYAAERVREALESLKSMFGWAMYGEDCDPWYFSDDRAPEFKQDVEKAKAVIAQLEVEREKEGAK